MKISGLLGLNVIYYVTVGSSSRLLGPFKSIGGSFLFFYKQEINMENPTYIYIYITPYRTCSAICKSLLHYHLMCLKFR